MANKALREKFREVENDAKKAAAERPLTDIEKFDNKMMGFIKFLFILFLVFCSCFILISLIGEREE